MMKQKLLLLIATVLSLSLLVSINSSRIGESVLSVIQTAEAANCGPGRRPPSCNWDLNYIKKQLWETCTTYQCLVSDGVLLVQTEDGTRQLTAAELALLETNRNSSGGGVGGIAGLAAIVGLIAVANNPTEFSMTPTLNKNEHSDLLTGFQLNYSPKDNDRHTWSFRGEHMADGMDGEPIRIGLQYQYRW